MLKNKFKIAELANKTYYTFALIYTDYRLPSNDYDTKIYSVSPKKSPLEITLLLLNVSYYASGNLKGQYHEKTYSSTFNLNGR